MPHRTERREEWSYRRLETFGVRHRVRDGCLTKAAVVQELEARVTREVNDGHP